MATVILLIIIYLSFIGLGLPDTMLGAAWPAMYRDLSAPIHYAGIISMITAAGSVVSSLMSARITRFAGTGVVTVSSVFLTAMALIGFSFSNNVVWLFILAIPLGLGAGSVDAALNNYVALHFKARHMNWLHCFWGIGASIGPLIMSAQLKATGSWSQGYMTVGIIQLCIVIVLLATLPLWKRSKREQGDKHAESTPHLSFRKIAQLPGVKQMLLGFFCYCTIEVVAGTWGTSFMVTVRNISPENAARWIGLYYIGITAGRFISGLFTLKINNLQLIRLGQIVILLGIVLMLLPYNASITTGFMVFGLGCAPIFPSMLHETPRSFGREYSQSIIGMQMASASLASTIMPMIFGSLASAFDFSIFPVFLGALLLISILLIEASKKKSRRLKTG
ncbi:MAG TPA: MFS transporter [Proteiniphilum sp.]|nr:MFS transporter [Proteiniphilum sp.]HPJ50841.1 MFS transporter [Proteiniphilum sp.]HPR20240.1 MFS transporter [Proteiniphilum sp.]